MSNLFICKITTNMEKKRQIKKWTKEEINTIIDFLKENRNFEQPTAQIYYKKMLEKSPIGATWDLIKWKVRHLKSTFNKAQDWKKSTGAGLLQEDEEAGTCSVKAKLQKICPYYADLQQVFGKNDIVVYTFDSEKDDNIGVSEDVQSTESVTFFDMVEDSGCSTILTEDNMQETPDRTARKSTFKKNLKRPASRDALSVLAQTQEERNANMRLKLEAEREQKKEELELEKERFRFEQEMKREEIRLKQLEIESKERLARLELELKYKK